MITSKHAFTVVVIALVIGMADFAKATPFTYNFAGVVTSFSSNLTVFDDNGNVVSSGPYPGPVFAPGDPFTGTFTYDPSKAFPDGSSNNVLTFSIDLGFGTSSETQGTFTTAEIDISQAPHAEFAFSPYCCFVDTYADLTLSNNSAPGRVPVPFKDYVTLANYPDKHDVSFVGESPNNQGNADGFFSMDGNITSLHAVPDAGTTFSLFAVSVIGLTVLRRKFC
jgi:hypothetical protein